MIVETKKALDDKINENILLQNQFNDLHDQFKLLDDQKSLYSSRLREAVSINDTLKNKLELEIEDLLIDKDRIISDLKHQVDVKTRQIEAYETSKINEYSKAYESTKSGREKIYVQDPPTKITERPSESSDNRTFPTEHYFKEDKDSSISEIILRIKQAGLKLDDFSTSFGKICKKVGI